MRSVVCDENIPLRFISLLREWGFFVISVYETMRWATDSEICHMIQINESLLITRDRDFWNLIRQKWFSIGSSSVLYMRWNMFLIKKNISKSVFEKLLGYNNKFIVINETKIRFREIL